MTARTIRKALAVVVVVATAGWSLPAAALPSAPAPAADSDAVQVDELELQVEDPTSTTSTTGGPTVDPGRDDAVLADRSLPGDRVATEVVETTDYQTVGVTWPESEPGADLAVEMRTRTGGTWTGWTSMAVSDASPDVGTADADQAQTRAGTDAVWIGDADAVQLSVLDSAADVADVRLSVIGSELPDAPAAPPSPSDAPASPAPSEAVPSEPTPSEPSAQPAVWIERASAAPATAASAAPAAVMASAPSVVTRSQWGAAAPTCTMGTAPLKGAVLHHTAGSNSYASTAEAMQQIRNDQRYHMQSRGWCDLGYNFVVDKWGTIYEGRSGSLTSSVIGVHAGGFNTGTVGISMLGTYSSVTPSSAVARSVAQIIGWKLRAYGIDPSGTMSYWTGAGENSRYSNRWVTLPRVFGHRDVAYTACPGDQGQAILPSVRQLARGYAGPMFLAPTLDRWSMPTGGTVTVSAPTISNISWTLTVTDDRTGIVMSTSNGLATEAWGGLVAAWGGNGPAGPVGPGPYRLTITGTDAGNGAAANTWSGVVEVTGTQNPPTVAPVPLTGDLRYVPVTPSRLADTRPTGQSLGAGSRLDLKVTDVGDIPADAKAVALNVTGVHASSTTFVRVWPAGQTMPGTSNLNLAPGSTAGAGVISAVGGDGKVSIYNNTGSLHLVVDVTGYFVEGAGSGAGLSAAGVRVYDSRTSLQGRLVAGKPRTVQVTGVGAIPPDATAVVANISSVMPAGEGNITAYPASSAVPATASVNHRVGDNVSNRTIVPLDADGRLALSLQGGSADVVVDVVGWFGPGQSLQLTPIVPQRAVDTRTGSGGKLGAGGSRAFVMETSAVPSDASAVLVSVAATEQTAQTFLTAWGSGARPSASDLNTGSGRDQANSTIVRLSTSRGGTVYNDRGTTHTVIDVLGYFR